MRQSSSDLSDLFAPTVAARLPRWTSVTSLVRRYPVGVLALTIVVALVIIGFVGPSAAPDPYELHAFDTLESPHTGAIFGTDNKGRDVFARTVAGLNVSIKVGLMAAGLGVTFGFGFALVTGYRRGLTDALGQRVVESLLAFPSLLLAMLLTVALGRSLINLAIIIALISWPSAARVIRSVVITQSASAYVEAARSVGASNTRIIFRHVAPNAASMFLVVLSVSIAQAILIEGSLSFLGLGIPPPQPSLGAMVADAQRDFQVAPHVALFPGATIALVVFAFNSLGDAVRDALDPKLRNR